MPDMSYGWAKLTCEYLAQARAYEKHGLKSICYRPFSGYGEDQDDAYPFPSICKRHWPIAAQPVLQRLGHRHADARLHPHRRLHGRHPHHRRPDRRRRGGESFDRYFYQFHRVRPTRRGNGRVSARSQGMSDKPAGVHARGGDTAKQRQLGFKHKIDFRAGIERALKHYSA